MEKSLSAMAGVTPSLAVDLSAAYYSFVFEASGGSTDHRPAFF
jgi:hypothetical protein